MPYILQDHRPVIDKAISELPTVMTDGEMNYAITQIMDRRLQFHGTNYATINMLIGVLECAKLELYRRIAAPYEDTKIAINGDAYHDQQ
jgi:hypothetical protein